MDHLESGIRQCRALVLSALVSMFAACGGGGGPGDGTSVASSGPGAQDAAPAAPAANGVSVAAAPNQFIPSERLQDSEGAAAVLDILAFGDVAVLQGQTIFVVVEDPDSLFKATPQVEVHQNPPGATITLDHRAVPAPGRFQGNLRVHVCLDAACRSELAGSPVRVPYDVTVLRGLQLDRDTIDITLPFGAIPPEQVINVTLPPNAGPLLVNDSTVRGFTDPLTTVDFAQSRSPDGTTEKLTFGIRPGTSGTHALTYEVALPVPLPSGNTALSRHTVTVRYVVTSDGSLPFVFLPATGNFSLLAGDGASKFAANPMLADVATTLIGVEYLSQPAAANGIALATNWFSTFDFTITGCTVGSAGTSCLPPGTYVAQLRYRIAFGRLPDALWPVTLTVLPQ